MRRVPVTSVTDIHGSDGNDGEGVKYLAKLVTGILLIVLSGMPAFAAIPCQQSVHSMPCCDGIMCPAMAKMSSNREITRKGMQDSPAPCCRTRARSFVAVTDHKATEIHVAIANFGVGTAVLPVRLDQFRHECVTVVNRRGDQRTQAVLSTFLI